MNDVANHHQEDIEKLLKFISVVSGYEHLHDIDSIWSRTEATEKQISDLIQQSRETLEKVKNDQVVIGELAEYKNRLLNIKHLEDADKLWEANESNIKRIEELQKQENDLRTSVHNNNEIIKNNQDMISELAEHKRMILDIKHLKEVDKLWEVNESNVERIAELQKQENETKSIVQSNKEFVESALAEIKEQNSFTVQSLTNKVKIAYLIAGSSVGLALIELIIILMKVI